MGRRMGVRVAAIGAAVLTLAACGSATDDDQTAVLGVVIDRNSEDDASTASA